MKIVYNKNSQLKKAIKQIIYENDYKMKDISNKLNLTSSYLSNMLAKKNINCDDIKKILDTMDYELVLEFRPKGSRDKDNNDGTVNTSDINKDIYDVELSEEELELIEGKPTPKGYSGNELIDQWLEDNGCIINPRLFVNGKLNSESIANLISMISYGRGEALLQSNLVIKVKD